LQLSRKDGWTPLIPQNGAWTRFVSYKSSPPIDRLLCHRPSGKGLRLEHDVQIFGGSMMYLVDILDLYK
jgi:hypothetical protein